MAAELRRDDGRQIGMREVSESTPLGVSRRPSRVKKMRKKVALLMLILLAVLTVGFLIALLDARKHLSRLQEQPHSDCPATGRLPPRPLDRIRQRDVDNGLVYHILREHPTRSRLLFVVKHGAYSSAVPILRNARQRRDLFARLPCSMRPRLYFWMRPATTKS